jgi:hypothetical protein
MVCAFGFRLPAFFTSQAAGEGRKISKPAPLLTVIPQVPEQLGEAFRGLLGAEKDLPPLFKPMRGGVTVGEPARDVVQRNAQQCLARGGISPFELVGYQIMQGIHGNSII